MVIGNMDEITTKLKELEIETLDNVRSSKANNTLKAYKSDFRDLKYFVCNTVLNPCLQLQKI